MVKENHIYLCKKGGGRVETGGPAGEWQQLSSWMNKQA